MLSKAVGEIRAPPFHRTRRPLSGENIEFMLVEGGFRMVGEHKNAENQFAYQNSIVVIRTKCVPFRYTIRSPEALRKHTRGTECRSVVNTSHQKYCVNHNKEEKKFQYAAYQYEQI